MLDDYLVCAAEARLLRIELGLTTEAAGSALSALDVRTDEVGALRAALAAGDVALAACEGRRSAESAALAEAAVALAAERERARRAERSRARWRSVALAGPVVVGVAGVVAGVLLAR